MDIRLDILERSSCATRILGYSSDNPASLTLLEPTYVHTRALLLFSKHCWSALKRPVKCAMNVPYVPHHVKLQTQLYAAVRHYRVLACLYITSQHTTLFSLKTPFGVLYKGWGLRNIYLQYIYKVYILHFAEYQSSEDVVGSQSAHSRIFFQRKKKKATTVATT